MARILTDLRSTVSESHQSESPLGARARLIAEIEITYRLGTVAKLGALLAQLLTETDTACNTRQ